MDVFLVRVRETRGRLLKTVRWQEINLIEIPPEDIIDGTFQAVVNQESENEPRIDVQVGNQRVKVYINDKASVTDPYVAIDIAADETLLILV